MFYVKHKDEENGIFIEIELNDENVYTTCPKCGYEFPIDLTEVFRDGEADFYSTSVLCEECSRKYLQQKGE